jgi:ribosome maturation factor RimP
MSVLQKVNHWIRTVGQRVKVRVTSKYNNKIMMITVIKKDGPQ